MGDRVAAGQVVARQERTDAEIALAEAKAARDQAAAELANLQEGSRPEEIRVTEAALDAARVRLREAERQAGRQIALEKSGARWRVAPAKWTGLHKTHALQGPIDDAFLDPFLLVRPTGAPWNEAAHQLSLKRLERFDETYARFYRAHPRVKTDREVTEADFAKYNVVLFGDPGSNRWIGRLAGRLHRNPPGPGLSSARILRPVS